MKKLVADILLATSPLSEQNSAPPANSCMSDPHFNDWDFWLGEWRVTDKNTGKFQGHNKVEKVEKGCFINENWTNAQGGKGYSLNYYNPNTKLWRQLWVSSGGGGYNIDYTGSLDANSHMVLIGHIHTYSNGSTSPFRGTWRKLEDGTVQQFFEQQDKNGKWHVWFDGLYSKAPKK